MANELTQEKLDSFASSLLENAGRDEPDTIWIASHWSDTQIRSVIVNSGVNVICDKDTYTRIERIKAEAQNGK